jgi:hypothetical protein
MCLSAPNIEHAVGIESFLGTLAAMLDMTWMCDRGFTISNNIEPFAKSYSKILFPF